MNPDQKIAIVSVISGGSVGLAGLLLAAIGGWRDRSATRSLAETERRQQRLADAYIDLLVMAEKVGHWAQSVRPILDTNPPSPAPDLPDLDTQMLVSAKVNAYGSPEAKENLTIWRDAVNDVRRADQLIGLRMSASDNHPSGMPNGGEWKDYLTPWGELVNTLRPAERIAREALADQVASELK